MPHPDASVPERSRRPAVFLRFPTIAITCGSAITIENEVEYDEHRPGSIQMLPEEPPPSPDIPLTRTKARSNGCGAWVHGGVCLTRREGEQCWYGWTKDVAPTVVPLETCYFTSVVGKFLGLADAGSEHCGCAVGGVGCAVCGNPLGTLQTVCATHAITAKRDVYLFLASAVSPAPHAEMSWIGETSPQPAPVSPLGSIPPFLPPAVPPVSATSSSSLRHTLARHWSVERHFEMDEWAEAGTTLDARHIRSGQEIERAAISERNTASVWRRSSGEDDVARVTAEVEPQREASGAGVRTARGAAHATSTVGETPRRHVFFNR
ncbi:hypothetical protein B0H13DRAFT_1941538 [Mycena leptocephala]|nr:hypothetical protein B0H13DRAFT_1941538 [Mycena leptocephala]